MLIEDVTIVNSPMWEIHPVLCTNVTVRRVTIKSHGPNNDGCDPESCRDVLIEHCVFDTGDDCIAIKSGRNADGRRLHAPTENVIVRDCEMRDGHGGVTIGSEISGDVRYVFADDCTHGQPAARPRAAAQDQRPARRRARAHLHARRHRGRGGRRRAADRLQLRRGRQGPFTPVVRDIEMRRVTSRKSNYGWYLRGFAADPIRDVRLIDCTFDQVMKGNRVEYVEGLALRRARIDGPARTPWSARVVDAAIARNPVVHEKWDYTAGLMLMAIQRVGDVTRRPAYGAYVRRNVDRLVQPDGSIATYRADEFNLDQINEGRVLFTLLETHDATAYRAPPTACASSCARSRARPKAASGTRRSIPQQMWLDGLYMAEPFYAEYAQRIGDAGDLNDVARQFLLVARHLRDPRTGLYYHAWDAARAAVGRQRDRAVEELLGARRGLVSDGGGRRARLPAGDASRSPGDHRHAAQPRRRRRARAGPGDRPLVAGARSAEPRRELSRGVGVGDVRVCLRQGRAARLPRRAISVRSPIARLRRPGRAFVSRSRRDGLVSVNNICKVAGLGGNPPRDGSYQYYVSEPVVSDDYKGVGPFMLAALELGR